MCFEYHVPTSRKEDIESPLWSPDDELFFFGNDAPHPILLLLLLRLPPPPPPPFETAFGVDHQSVLFDQKYYYHSVSSSSCKG
jgi:hypothetical protein